MDSYSSKTCSGQVCIPSGHSMWKLKATVDEMMKLKRERESVVPRKTHASSA